MKRSHDTQMPLRRIAADPARSFAAIFRCEPGQDHLVPRSGRPDYVEMDQSQYALFVKLIRHRRAPLTRSRDVVSHLGEADHF